MRIFLLSDSASSHTYKWVKSLSENGFEIFLFSLSKSNDDLYKDIPLAGYQDFDLTQRNLTHLSKLKYLKVIPSLKRVIREFKPDIVHAHYATSYGLIGRLSDFHPFLISVWGSDVLDFPKKSFLHKWFLKRNLLSADEILCTSNTLREKVLEIAKKDSVVIPFGIDLNIFKPEKVSRFNGIDEDAIVIGTIKSLEKHYCIDVLIKAFAEIFHQHPVFKLRLLIVGKGREENNLKSLVSRLGLNKAVVFAGRIAYDEVHKFHNMIDVFVNLSEYESFGVSLLEASACGKPVVATDTGGLREVVSNNETGFLVQVKNIEETVIALEKLILNERLRKEMGEAGRTRVMKYYAWDECLKNMKNIYLSYLNSSNHSS